MTLKADQRLCLGRKVHDIQEGGGVALFVEAVVLFRIVRQILYCQASRTVTRLAIHQGKSCFRFYLLPMYATPEIVGDSVMLVAFGHTVVGSDIFGI